MKTPDRCRSGTPPSAENGLRGLYFGVWCYRRPTIGASPATFHTVSEGEFCELRHNGVLGSSAKRNSPKFAGTEFSEVAQSPFQSVVTFDDQSKARTSLTSF